MWLGALLALVAAMLWLRFGPRQPPIAPPIPSTTLHLEVPGARLGYQVEGPEGAPAVLMFSPMGSIRGCWKAQAEALSARYRVIRFDNRGLGDSGPLPSDWSFAMGAADAVALLDHLGIERAHVVGMSMGGMLAQTFALASPERVSSLSLIATSPGGGGLPAARGLWLAVWRGVALWAQRGLWAQHLLGQALFSPGWRRSLSESESQRQAAVWGLPPTPAVLSAHAGAVSGFDSREGLGAWRERGVPTLIVSTDEADVMIPPAQQALLREALPDARHVGIAGAGHGVIVERPEEVNRALLGFLRDVED